MVLKRRVKRVYKSLPSHTNEASPLANAGEANKALIIAIIAIVALIGLSLLLFFSDTFVGKAITATKQAATTTQTQQVVQQQISPTGCGDGNKAFGEECDDGNTNNGDGCSASCKNEICTDVPPNLLAWWPFESYYAGMLRSNTGITDAVPQGSNAPSLINDGKVGKGVEFSNNYFVAQLGVNPNPTSGLSVSAWVKSKQSSGYSGVWQLVSKYEAYILGSNAANSNRICFLVSKGSWYPANYATGTGCYAVPNPDQWHHFVGTYDPVSKQIKLYVDGVLRASQPGPDSINADTGPVTMGVRESDKSESSLFLGYMDEVAIFDRVLADGGISVGQTASGEVGNIFKAGSAGMCAIKNSVCGNGIKEYNYFIEPEECDDGNSVNGDGCNIHCRNELCANLQDKRPNLVAWWNGDDEKDATGLNNGILQNGAKIDEQPGKVGKSFLFDGVDDYVEVPDSVYLSPTQKISVAAWVKSYDSSGLSWATGSIVSKRNAFVLHPLGNQVTFYIHDGSWKNSGYSGSFDPTDWHHVVGVYDGNVIKIFVDGVKRNEKVIGPVSITDDNGPLFIGWDDEQPNRYFKGKIDEVQIYDNDLTDAEVLALFQTGSAGMCVPKALVCGNNILQSGEQCDDGNTVDGDGCSAICQIEVPALLGDASGDGCIQLGELTTFIDLFFNGQAEISALSQVIGAWYNPDPQCQQ